MSVQVDSIENKPDKPQCKTKRKFVKIWEAKYHVIFELNAKLFLDK